MGPNRIFCIALFVSTVLASTIPTNAQGLAVKESTVLSFDGTDGAFTYSDLVSDGTNLYGTAYVTLPSELGNVFELSPPASGKGAWTQTVLWSFTGGNDGYNPYTGLILDKKGNLYGTAGFGGYRDENLCFSGCGTVFELSPPSQPGGAWSETTLYQFKGSADGSEPLGSLIFDPAGNLYGTTLDGGGEYTCCGTAYELSPPAVPGGAWTETVLHDFVGGNDGEDPYGPLYRDSKGNLYGTTTLGGSKNGYGTIFRISPGSDGSWTEEVLYAFTGTTDGQIPYSGVVEYDGALYGTASLGGNLDDCYDVGIPSGCGTVYKLSLGQGENANFSVVYAFKGSSDGLLPRSGLTIDQHGNLYGATVFGGNLDDKSCNGYFKGCGVIFAVSPQSGGSWKETVLHAFDLTNGFAPSSTLLINHDALWGTTMQGGTSSVCDGDCGVVFEIYP